MHHLQILDLNLTRPWS